MLIQRLVGERDDQGQDQHRTAPWRQSAASALLLRSAGSSSAVFFASVLWSVAHIYFDRVPDSARRGNKLSVELPDVPARHPPDHRYLRLAHGGHGRNVAMPEVSVREVA